MFRVVCSDVYLSLSEMSGWMGERNRFREFLIGWDKVIETINAFQIA